VLSLQVLKDNLHRIFVLSRTDKFEFQTVYKDKVYIVSIEPTSDIYIKPPPTMTRRRFDIKKDVAIQLADCKTCRSVVVSGVCINKACNSYSKVVEPIVKQ